MVDLVEGIVGDGLAIFRGDWVSMSDYKYNLSFVIDRLTTSTTKKYVGSKNKLNTKRTMIWLLENLAQIVASGSAAGAQDRNQNQLQALRTGIKISCRCSGDYKCSRWSAANIRRIDAGRMQAWLWALHSDRGRPDVDQDQARTAGMASGSF